MGLFTPHKKHANPFRYIPRYYDPEKERREQRRRELHGTSNEQEMEAGEAYTPGQYIRARRKARLERASAANSRKQTGLPKLALVAGIALLIIFVYMLYPRIVGAFATVNRAMQAEQKSQAEYEVEAFNPHAPITIVPNDYKEE